MKDDKFLIGIVAGIVVLVVVALAVVIMRAPQNEEYLDSDSPEAVVHNYFLAIQRKDYEKAYSYLADDLQSKPNLDEFIRVVDNNARNQETSLSIGETRLGDAHTQVDVVLTTYRQGGIFDSNSYTSRETAFLRATNGGNTWKLTQFPYPFWGYDWHQE